MRPLLWFVVLFAILIAYQVIDAGRSRRRTLQDDAIRPPSDSVTDFKPWWEFVAAWHSGRFSSVSGLIDASERDRLEPLLEPHSSKGAPPRIVVQSRTERRLRNVIVEFQIESGERFRVVFEQKRGSWWIADLARE